MRQGGQARVVTATSELCVTIDVSLHLTYNHPRHECRKFTITFYLPRYNHPAEYGHGGAKDRELILGRFGWIRESRQDRSFRSNARRGKEDQQVTICSGYGHQRSYGWKGMYKKHIHVAS